MTHHELKAAELAAQPWIRVFRLERLTDGHVYFGFAPEIPGCFTQASTLEAAEENLSDAIYLVLLDQLERGKPVPSPACETDLLVPAGIPADSASPAKPSLVLAA